MSTTSWSGRVNTMLESPMEHAFISVRRGEARNTTMEAAY
jgi:hypothetical protein